MKTIRRFLTALQGAEEKMASTDIAEDLIQWNKKQKPEMYGNMSDKEIAYKLNRQKRDDIYRLRLGIESSHNFSLDDNAKRLILLNDPPQENEVLAKVKLPFPSIYIDVEFDEEDGVEFTDSKDKKIVGC